MKQTFVGLLVCVLVFVISCKTSSSFVLVENGIANAVIVTPSEMTRHQQLAVDYFIDVIFKSTGAKLKVLLESDFNSDDKSTPHLIIGPSLLTSDLMGDNDVLLPEQYRILPRDNNLIVLATDIGNKDFKYSSFVTLWALDYILENYVGVKWLWPGTTGTVIPKHSTIKIPSIEVSEQPYLEKRKFRYYTDNEELIRWCAHHQVVGERKSYEMGHAFTDKSNNGNWWTKFSKTKPELLAKDPNGKVTLRNPSRADFFKLDISNPDVVQEVLRLWKDAGRPDFWNVAPNDSRGFCTCDRCLAIDRQYGYVYTKEQIWSEPVNLTDRYVWFWNQLISEMKKENPDVQIGTYFYSVYRNAPKSLKLESGIVGGLVSGFDFSSWQEWTEAGASGIGLRPNWWHMGANGPHLPLTVAGNFIIKARQNKMIYIDMDSLMEYWATQGPYYYLVARLVSKPEMDIEEVLSEFCDAFGDASGEIRNYLNYWEEYHKKVAYNIPAGGAVSQDSTGMYEQICWSKFGRLRGPLDGHWLTLPDIYTPEVLNEGFQLLLQASNSVSDQEILNRIEFLRDGLHQLEHVIQIISAGEEQLKEKITALENFTILMTEKYGYWGNNGIEVMIRRGVIGNPVDLEGL